MKNCICLISFAIGTVVLKRTLAKCPTMWYSILNFRLETVIER